MLSLWCKVGQACRVCLSLSKAIVGQFSATLSSCKDVPTQPINPDPPLGLKSLPLLFVGVAVSALPIIIFMAFLVTVSGSIGPRIEYRMQEASRMDYIGLSLVE